MLKISVIKKSNADSGTAVVNYLLQFNFSVIDFPVLSALVLIRTLVDELLPPLSRDVLIDATSTEYAESVVGAMWFWVFVIADGLPATAVTKIDWLILLGSMLFWDTVCDEPKNSFLVLCVNLALFRMGIQVYFISSLIFRT